MDSEVGKLKMLAVIFVLFIFSCFKSCESLKYTMSGDTQETTVSKITESRGRKGRVTYTVWYNFKNDGKSMTGKTNVSKSVAYSFNEGDDIEVEVLSGERPSTRLSGTGNTFWVLLFFISLGFIIFGFIKVFIMPKPKSLINNK